VAHHNGTAAHSVAPDITHCYRTPLLSSASSIQSTFTNKHILMPIPPHLQNGLIS